MYDYSTQFNIINTFGLNQIVSNVFLNDSNLVGSVATAELILMEVD